jgi:hypothetical protein
MPGRPPAYHAIDCPLAPPGDQKVIFEEHAIEAIGWLSAELAGRADAWNGNAPDWFPEPPEFLDLWRQALASTKRTTEGTP